MRCRTMRFWFSKSKLGERAMKTTVHRISLAVAILLVGNRVGWAQANFYGNTLTLNGHPMSITIFGMNSRGVLALVEGDPRMLPRRKPIPFRVLLRRAGTVVRQWPANNTGSVYSLELDNLWPVARFGDELVIESGVDPTDKPAEPVLRRVIRLTQINLFGWLADGC